MGCSPLGGIQCPGTNQAIPSNITLLSFTKQFFNNTGVNYANGRKVLHLLRRLKNCYGYYNGVALILMLQIVDGVVLL